MVHRRPRRCRPGRVDRPVAAGRPGPVAPGSSRGSAADPAEASEISGIDALEHVAKLALDAMDPGTAAGRRPTERYLVDCHLSAAEPEISRLHLGPALPAWLRSLVTCDAEVRAWVERLDGNVNLGRRQHTVDPKLRTVVEHRDGGCSIAGCEATHWLTIHHIRHWAQGGRTDTSNLVALCPPHHRLVHQGELVLTGNPDSADLLATTANGEPLGPSRPRPPNGPLLRAAAEAGLPSPRWTNRSGERAQWRWFAWQGAHQGGRQQAR